MRPMPPRFVVDVEDVPQGKLLRLKGEVNAEEADILRAHLMPVLSGKIKPKLVVFDLSELRFIASAGLGALAGFRRSLVNSGAQGRLAAIPEKLRDVLRLAGLTQLYAVFDTVEKALA